MAKVKVRCSYEVEIEVPDEWVEDGHVFYYVEEHECPGTGLIGEQLYEMLDAGERDGICCFCGRNGENKVLEINGKPVEHR